MRRLLAMLVLYLGVWAGPLQAAEQVPLRSGLHADYGRLVFDWPDQVDYQARLEAGDLVVQFAEPAELSGKPLREGLRGYAAPPQVSEDGRRLSFALAGEFELKHFRIGSKVVLDLRRGVAKPSQEPAPKAEGEATAEELPRIKVRSGRHPDHSRLVFDWPERVDSRIEQSAGRVRIVFGRRARFDVSAVRPAGLPQVSAVTAQPDGLSVELAQGAKPRLSRSGSKVILDLVGSAESGPSKAKAKPQKTPAVADLSARKKAASDEKAAQTPTPQDRQAAVEATPSKVNEPDEVVPSGTRAGGAQPAGPTPLVPKSMGGEAEGPAPKKASDAAAEDGGKARQQALRKPPAGSAQPTEGGNARFFGEAPAAVSDFPDAVRGRLQIALEPVLSFENSAAQGPTADRFVPIILTFSWDRPTAAAAFRRGEHLWLVFDRPPPRDLVKRLAAGAPHLGSVRLVEAGRATVMVIGARPTVAPRLSREDNSWVVDLRPRSPLPQKALAAPLVEEREYKRVRFPMSGADRLIWVTDPDAGDRLVVVPTRGAGMGMTLPYAYPQFRSLASQQGVILQPLTSTLEVAVIRSGVLVRDSNGLLVSSAEERRTLQRNGGARQDEPRLFDLVSWRRGGQEDYQSNRRDLMAAMFGLSGDPLGVRRAELARFYFAHGLDSEALGSLRVIEEEHPRLAESPEHRLMKAASQWLIQDYRAAAGGLSHPSLAEEREALLWQAALAAQAEDWQAAANGFAAAEGLIDSYPRRVRLRLRLAAAEAHLGAGDHTTATLQLGVLRREGLKMRERAQMAVVQGALQLMRGNAKEARELWEMARDSRHRPSQARARLALIDLGLQEESLSTDEAIAELERLRFAWRGDQFEFTLLRRLAELYVDRKRHREALYALRQAVTGFPDSPGARASTQEMREIFAEIYRGVGDPEVPPLRALALFQEFRELTPTGPEGDRLITSLADRLVEVDLLDRAAELLEGQVRYRLQGEEKARIGARLALVHLLDRNPEASLSALDISNVEEVGQPLALQRRQLRARALSDLNRPKEALAMLEGDESLDAETLRADIHWRLRRWPAAVDSLSKLIPLLPPRRAMTLQESQMVVNLAVALMLSNQTVELEDLDRRYGAAMAQGPHSDTFDLLVGDGEKSAISSIADELSKVAKAQDFMANYRERLRDGALSKVN